MEDKTQDKVTSVGSKLYMVPSKDVDAVLGSEVFRLEPGDFLYLTTGDHLNGQLLYIDLGHNRQKVNLSNPQLFKEKIKKLIDDSRASTGLFTFVPDDEDHTKAKKRTGQDLTIRRIELAPEEVNDLITSNGGFLPEFGLADQSQHKLHDLVNSITSVMSQEDISKENRQQVTQNLIEFFSPKNLKKFQRDPTFIKTLTDEEWHSLIEVLGVFTGDVGQYKGVVKGLYQSLQQAPKQTQLDVVRDNCDLLIGHNLNKSYMANIGDENNFHFLAQCLQQLHDDNPLVTVDMNNLFNLTISLLGQMYWIEIGERENPLSINYQSILLMVFDALEDRPEHMVAMLNQTISPACEKFLSHPAILDNVMNAAKKMLVDNTYVENQRFNLATTLIRRVASKEGFDAIQYTNPADWRMLLDIAISQCDEAEQIAFFNQAMKYTAGQEAVWERLIHKPNLVEHKTLACKGILHRIAKGEWSGEVLKHAMTEDWPIIMQSLTAETTNDLMRPLLKYATGGDWPEIIASLPKMEVETSMAFMEGFFKHATTEDWSKFIDAFNANPSLEVKQLLDQAYTQHRGNDARLDRQIWLANFCFEVGQLKLAESKSPKNRLIGRACLDASDLFSTLRGQFHQYDTQRNLNDDAVQKIRQHCQDKLNLESSIMAGANEINESEVFGAQSKTLVSSLEELFKKLNGLVNKMPSKDAQAKIRLAFMRPPSKVTKPIEKVAEMSKKKVNKENEDNSNPFDPQM